ncbi:unnamed protein product [Linum trigynum]|uniref:Uncharacterized protein n=1 Tax=Linum trigynum TaxID=586398 RepID=A0AAV2CXV2_9ROSI
MFLGLQAEEDGVKVVVEVDMWREKRRQAMVGGRKEDSMVGRWRRPKVSLSVRSGRKVKQRIWELGWVTGEDDVLWCVKDERLWRKRMAVVILKG